MSNNKDPFYSAGPPGSWGRPDIVQNNQPRIASNAWWSSKPGEFRADNEAGARDGLFERFSAAMNSRPDTRFARVAARVSKMFRW